MNRGTIQIAVEKAIQELVTKESSAKVFGFDLVPYKKRRDGGLGVTMRQWSVMIRRLGEHYLPKQGNFPGISDDATLVVHTYDKSLTSLLYQVTNRIALRKTLHF
tara:strand:+ start:188 stop:502 length:315 start_codon:yes stop_codon:yes gene_type:complete